MDELEEVLVAGHDRDLEAGGDGLRRQRSDHVVGFEPLVGEDRNAERFARLVHPRNLLGEIRRHRRAVGLVVGRHFRSEGGTRQIERGGDELRVVVLNQLPQHGDEDVDGVRRPAAGTGQPAAAHRVIRAVHLRAAVDQKEALGHSEVVRPGQERAAQRREGADIQYIIRGMSLSCASRRARRPDRCARRIRRLQGGIFGKQYQYEEDLYLALDGSATLVVNASVPALVALRGLDARPDPATRLDPTGSAPRTSRPVTEVTRISPPWRRDGRRFVQVRLEVQGHSQAERGRAVLVVALRARRPERAPRLRAEGRCVSAAAGHAAERRLERLRTGGVPAAPAQPDHLAQLARSRNRPAAQHRRAATSCRGNST